MSAISAPVSKNGALRAALVAALLFVGFRSTVWIAFEQSHFDSDQGVWGLMAMHLAGRRALPLFFYGQRYMLAVETWLTAPLVLLLGPSVATLKLVPLAFNLATAWLLLCLLVRRAGLRAHEALVVSIFFLLPPPIPSSRLVEAAGGNIEPLFYVLLLWCLRERPMVFGLVAGVAVTNREFTAYGIAALVAIDLFTGALFTTKSIQTWVLRLGTMIPTMAALHLLERYADLRGPGTAGAALAQGRQPICWNLAELSVNLRWLVSENLSNVFGWKAEHLGTYVQSNLDVGGRLIWLPLLAALVVAAAAGIARRTHAPRDARAFAGYLTLVGIFTVGAYVMLGCTVRDGMLLRYTLLALFLPMGALLLFFSTRPPAALRYFVSVAVVLWAVASATDHVRLMGEYIRTPPPDTLRELTSYLEANGVRYGYAPYWTSYAVDFLSGERIKLASSEFSRIEEYYRLAQEHDDEAIKVLVDAPCPDGVAFRRWCLLYLDNARKAHPASPN